MKTNQNPGKDDELHETLQSWRVNAAMPPHFQKNVWRRIALAEERTEISLWEVLSHRLQSTFSRPLVALGYALLLLAVGSSIGYLHAQAKARQAEIQWRMQYIQSVDPYQMPMN